MPNAKFLAHLPHQTQKTSNIKCVKFYNFYNMYTVPLQICNGTELKWYNFNHFFILFSLSSLFTLFFSLLSHSSSDITPLHSFLLSLFFLLNLVVFISSSQTSPSVFSSHSFLHSLQSLSLWFFFFFFLCSDLIPGSAVGGLRW